MGRVEAAADGGGELAQEIVAGVLPEPEGVRGRDAFAAEDFAANLLGVFDSDHRFSLVLLRGPKSGAWEASGGVGAWIKAKFALFEEHSFGDS